MLCGRFPTPRKCGFVGLVSYMSPEQLMRADELTPCRRHAVARHKAAFCRNCCVFYDSRFTYCPDCHMFCMSPTCYPETSIAETGDALRQRHSRTPRCPKVWGNKDGVGPADLWEYLNTLCELIHIEDSPRDDTDTTSRLST